MSIHPVGFYHLLEAFNFKRNYLMHYRHALIALFSSKSLDDMISGDSPPREV